MNEKEIIGKGTIMGVLCTDVISIIIIMSEQFESWLRYCYKSTKDIFLCWFYGYMDLTGIFEGIPQISIGVENLISLICCGSISFFILYMFFYVTPTVFLKYWRNK